MIMVLSWYYMAFVQYCTVYVYVYDHSTITMVFAQIKKCLVKQLTHKSL